jgi:hypothetical protein
MIDNSIKDNHLFRFYASECCFRDIITNQLINHTFISVNDMKYILINSNSDQLEVIFSLFNIPIRFISNTVNQINSNNLITCIKYIFTFHCFGKFNDDDNSYIYRILVCLISNKKTSVLKYFLNKKREYIVRGRSIDYQSLINKCIELQDKVHLEILMKEQKYDNDRGLLETSFIIINTHRVIRLCESAKFDYLKYLVKNYLGKSINTSIYIDSICTGLEKLILYDNIKMMTNIELLSDYIDDDKKSYINEYITKCYDNIKLDKSKRILM